MKDVLFLCFVQLTVYLGKRDFVDHLDHVDPVGESARCQHGGAVIDLKVLETADLSRITETLMFSFINVFLMTRCFVLLPPADRWSDPCRPRVSEGQERYDVSTSKHEAFTRRVHRRNR